MSRDSGAGSRGQCPRKMPQRPSCSQRLLGGHPVPATLPCTLHRSCARHFFGREYPDDPDASHPATAAEGIAYVEHAYALWRSYLNALEDQRLWDKLGEASVARSEEPLVRFLLQYLEEPAHLAAEVRRFATLPSAVARQRPQVDEPQTQRSMGSPGVSPSQSGRCRTHALRGTVKVFYGCSGCLATRISAEPRRLSAWR